MVSTYMRKMVRHVYEIFEEFYQPSRLVDWWVPWSNPVLPPCTWEPAGPGVFEHRTLGEPAHCWLGTSRASSVGGWLAKDFLEKLMFSEMMLCPPPTPTDRGGLAVLSLPGSGQSFVSLRPGLSLLQVDLWLVTVLHLTFLSARPWPTEDTWTALPEEGKS